MPDFRDGRGAGGEGGAVITDNRKGSLVKGQFCILTRLTHVIELYRTSHTHTHTHVHVSTRKTGKSDKLRGCSNVNIMAMILYYGFCRCYC